MTESSDASGLVLLADECTFTQTIRLMRSLGGEVVRVQDVDLTGAPDAEVFQTAQERNAVLVATTLHETNAEPAQPASNSSLCVILRSVSDEESLRIQRKRRRLRLLPGLFSLIPKRFFATLRMTHGKTIFWRASKGDSRPRVWGHSDVSAVVSPWNYRSQGLSRSGTGSGRSSHARSAFGHRGAVFESALHCGRAKVSKANVPVGIVLFGSSRGLGLFGRPSLLLLNEGTSAPNTASEHTKGPRSLRSQRSLKALVHVVHTERKAPFGKWWRCRASSVRGDTSDVHRAKL